MGVAMLLRTKQRGDAIHRGETSLLWEVCHLPFVCSVKYIIPRFILFWEI
jgi:hypothetical protein